MGENFRIAFGLLGGLAVFIYGMNLMSESLQKAAGERMKAILALLTKTPITGVLAGALATAVLQSSSATTVMAIGFVSAGLMNLPQAISIIFGANIGTTMTAQLIAFKIDDYIYAIIFIGFIISFIARKEKTKNIGQTIFAFGLLFLGIETMGSVMEPLAASPVFTELIGKVADIPVLGVLVGTGMTLVVQSSSATIAVLQNFAEQAGPDGVSSVIGLVGAIPILLGDNIGTTITAVLASIGQSKDAKRTAVAHCTFNVTGTLLFIWFIEPLAKFIQYISPKGPEIEIISRQIANTHTFFNIVMTIIWVPLIGLMVKWVMKVIPDGSTDAEGQAEAMYLEERLITQPTMALHLVAKEMLHYGEYVGNILKKLPEIAKTNDEKYIRKLLKEVDGATKLNERITNYLSDMFTAGVLTEQQAQNTAGLMYVLNDINNINEMCGKIGATMLARVENKHKYSNTALTDLENSLELIRKMYRDAMIIMVEGDKEKATKILTRKDEVTNFNLDMRAAHMDRVKKGTCSASLTSSLNGILHDVDRMSGSCVNIADAVLGKVDMQYFLNIVDV